MNAVSRLFVTLLFGITASAAALAQSNAPAEAGYPSRTIRIINPYSVGGPTDTLARIVGNGLSTRWGQPAFADSKAGAGGGIGMELAARAPGDGYTLVVAPTGPLVINKHIFSDLRYDTANDFAPISMLSSIDNVLIVSNDLPAQNLKELVAYAKANPTKISYGSPGVGTQPHLASEMLKRATGIQMIHSPYKGTTEALTALMGNQITMLLAQQSSVSQLILTGKVRAIGIASNKRSPVLPSVPTLQEQGLTGFESASVYALLAPKSTPAPIVEKLSNEVQAILKDSVIRKRIADMGMDVVAGTSAELASFMRTESARYEKIVKEENLQAR
jgi:tripartite-type tricarboxylate transporter receptor subunit TctC